ncbi:MAG: T9SS type A sorting domain-containing protein, partial [Bacteroidales bacterium]
SKIYGDDEFELKFKSSEDSTITYRLFEPTDIVSLDGTTVSILNAGTVKVIAILDCPNYYRVDTTFTIIVNKAEQKISDISDIINTYSPSGSFSLTGISNSELSVSYRLSETSAKDIISILGNTVNILGAGTVSVIAYQWGSRNYLAADSVVFTVLIEKAKQLILPIENIVHSFDIGQFDVHGFASSGLDVSFSVPNGNGVLIIQNKQFQVVGVGNVMVTASQIGNKDYLPANDITFLVTIYKATPIITPDTTIIKTIGDPSFILPQQSTNKSPITFTIEEGTCIDVSGNEATIKSIGEVTIIASQEENDHYAAVSIKFKIVVNRMQQSIITDSHIEKTYGDADFYIEADATSELPLKYTILLGNNFISMQDNKVNILNAGIAKVKIEQEGTEDRYEPASTVITIEIRKKSQTLTSVQNITEYVTASSFELPDFYASSGLPVDVKVPESNGVLHIRENTVYIEQLGSVDIELEQRGNNNYLPASHVFTITIVDVSPLIIEEPSSFESFDGGHYCFVVKATGSNLIYRWYFNGMLISGADSATYCIDYLEKDHTGTYSVLVSNTAGSISSKEVSLLIHTLPDLESLVRLYPNPTTGITYLEIPNILSLEEVVIRNEMGSFVKAIKGNGNFYMQVDIGNLASGFYFVQVKMNRGTIVKRLMKIK